MIPVVSPVASAEKIQTAKTNLGIPDGFIAYDVVPLLYQLVVALGNVTSGGSGSAITGEVKIWTAAAAPTGYLLCDGSAISRTTYSSLFDVIGETYGTGDGTTTFNLPDFQGRVPAGVGGSVFTTLGLQIGENLVTLTENQLPVVASHQHSINTSTTPVSVSAGSDVTAVEAGGSSTGAAGGFGGGQSHNNIQPSLAINFIIKT